MHYVHALYRGNKQQCKNEEQKCESFSCSNYSKYKVEVVQNYIKKEFNYLFVFFLILVCIESTIFNIK